MLHYQISNKGCIKSLKRNTETILKPSIDKTKGYYRICLYKNNKRKSYYIHQLIAMAFLGHIPNGNLLVVDHINNDKTDNELGNLQVITSRENSSKDQWRRNPTSKYTGVSYHSAKGKFESCISVNGESHHLGYYSKETDAALEYKRALDYYEKYSSLTNYRYNVRKRKFNCEDKNQLILEL